MANNYLQFSEILKIRSKKEALWWRKALDAADDSDVGMDFSAVVEGGEVHFFAGESGDVYQLAVLVQRYFQTFKLGGPANIFTLTWSETCSRMRVGEFGGGYLLVTADEIILESVNEMVQREIESLTHSRLEAGPKKPKKRKPKKKKARKKAKRAKRAHK